MGGVQHKRVRSRQQPVQEAQRTIRIDISQLTRQGSSNKENLQISFENGRKQGDKIREYARDLSLGGTTTKPMLNNHQWVSNDGTNPCDISFSESRVCSCCCSA